MSFTNWLAPEAVSGTADTGLAATPTTVAANATIGACIAAIATALTQTGTGKVKNAFNAPYIEETLDKLQCVLRALNFGKVQF